MEALRTQDSRTQGRPIFRIVSGALFFLFFLLRAHPLGKRFGRSCRRGDFIDQGAATAQAQHGFDETKKKHKGDNDKENTAAAARRRMGNGRTDSDDRRKGATGLRAGCCIHFGFQEPRPGTRGWGITQERDGSGPAGNKWEQGGRPAAASLSLINPHGTMDWTQGQHQEARPQMTKTRPAGCGAMPQAARQPA